MAATPVDDDTPLRRMQRRTERLVDARHRALAAPLGEIVRRHAEETPDGPRITPLGQIRILAEVDVLLDRVYPKRRGAPSWLEEATVAMSTEARAQPIRDAVKDIRRRVGPRLAERMADGDPTD